MRRGWGDLAASPLGTLAAADLCCSCCGAPLFDSLSSAWLASAYRAKAGDKSAYMFSAEELGNDALAALVVLLDSGRWDVSISASRERRLLVAIVPAVWDDRPREEGP